MSRYKIFHKERILISNKSKLSIEFVKKIFHYRGLLRGKLTSIKDIIAGDFPNVEIIKLEKTRLYYSPPIYSNKFDKKSEMLEGKDYLQYSIRIYNAIVYGESNAVALTSQKLLYDMPVFDESERYQYTDFNTKIYKIKKNNIYYWKGKTRTLEKAIWIGGSLSWNYYHLLYEFVIKFVKLNELDIPLDVPVLVDQVCFSIPQYKELLDIANQKRYRLIEIECKSRIKVGELIYIAPPNFIPPNNKNINDVRPDDTQFNIRALLDLRNCFLSHSSRNEFPKRIYISRKNASHRRRFNENEIIQVLSEFGFTAVYPETLSIPDQVSLFNKAEWIIGGAGAAFTNLLFCSAGCKVVMFAKFKISVSNFSTIACAVNADLVSITEEDTNKNVSSDLLHDSYELDPSYLREFLINAGL